LLRPVLRLAHRRFRHSLAEGNRSRFEDTAAGITFWRCKVSDQSFDHFVGIIFAVAFKAKHFAITAMELDDFIVRHTRLAVQAVHVLRNEADQLSFRIEGMNEVVADVRLGIFILLPTIESSLPCSSILDRSPADSASKFRPGF